MKQFKELTIDEQLDLIKHLLEGNDLNCRHSPNFETSLIGGKDRAFLINKDYYYSKQPTKLEILYKEQEAIQEKIDAELKRLGKSVTNDNVEVVQSPSEDEKTSENDSLERITYENWKSLGIKIGDRVKFEKVDDGNFENGSYKITDFELHDYDGDYFVELENSWWGCSIDDIAYLIRTKEGSLND